MAEPVRVAVLLSGRGTNMVALVEHKRRDPARAYEIALVASNVPEARGLVVAKRFGLKIWAKSHQGMSREEFDAALDLALREHGIELVALAGCVRLLSPGFADAWPGRLLNVHPSLLPAHRGLDTHRRALIAGDEFAGCSVHLVTAELDAGPVLAQEKVRILPRDDPESLAARVLKAEHRLYPAALEAYCALIVQANGPDPIGDASLPRLPDRS